MSVPRGVSVADAVGYIIADIRSKGDQLDKLQQMGHGDFGIMTVDEEWNVRSIAPIQVLFPEMLLRI